MLPEKTLPADIGCSVRKMPIQVESKPGRPRATKCVFLGYSRTRKKRVLVVIVRFFGGTLPVLMSPSLQKSFPDLKKVSDGKSSAYFFQTSR